MKFLFYQLAKRYITKTNQIKYVLLQVSLIRNSQNIPDYYYAQVVDITDLSHLLENYQNFSKQQIPTLDIPLHQRTTSSSYDIIKLYSQQNSRKANHLGHIAHELKNPLNGVKGFANMMKKSYEKGDSVNADLAYDRFIKNCNLLESLINDLLDLTYIESGNLKLEVSEFEITSTVKEIIDSIEEMANNHNIPVKFKNSLKFPMIIRSDKKRVQEILFNLLSNAIKYTEDGSVELIMSYQASYLEVSVIDSGIGIEQEDLTNIFDEYKKVHSKLKKEVDSTGLGLPITKRLVKLIGGDISVDSTPGIGSRFTINIPTNLSL